MKSPLIFRVFKNEQIHLVKQFVDRDQIVIGHEAEVDIDLDSGEISSIHCLIEKRGGQFYICDLGSAQGTYKNGQSILDEAINSGDEFTVGPFRIVFFMGAPKPVHTPNGSSEIIIEPVKPVTAVIETPLAPVNTPVALSPAEAPPSAPPMSPPPATVNPVTSTAAAPDAPATNVAPPDTEPAADDKPIKQSPPLSKFLKPLDERAAEALVKHAPKPEKPKIESETIVSQPSPRAQQFIKQRKAKGSKTFAPESEIKDLREIIRPGKGQLLEVIVSWEERILNTYHFIPKGMKKLGKRSDIEVPDGSAPKGWTFLDCTQNVTVRSTSEMKVEVMRDGVAKEIQDPSYRLQQNESVFVTLVNGMKLIVRYAPVPPVVLFESPLILSSSELTGILASLIIAALAALIVSVMRPKAVIQEEEVQRVAQVIFEKPPIPIPLTPPPPTPPPPEPVKPVVQEKPKPPPEPKKVVVADKQVAQKTKGDPKLAEQKSQAAQSASKASEVKPKDSKLKAKMFTSTKQGGAVKTGNNAAANAQSKEPDPTNSGLLAAFGSGGSRSKLDKAYSGTGELLGAGEKATGSSGFNENRAGDDLGSKFKDTGAGGKGTATSGIAGIGTQGRGSGQAAYGSGTGFGSKDQVAIQAGGAEEAWDGTIDREAVRRVVRSALTAFKSCYEREYKKDSKLEGKVYIVWEIIEKGVAVNARVDKAKSTINNSAVEECVRTRLLALRFPEPPAGSKAEVTYPFMFQGQK
ncbi:MAG: AgmX/PglI C-terminal domain-containing protein [Bdellovibrio sp.]|nr:AgmX/PglI C-terminal domain-containing protein [Bdellovibrio sp.]